NADVILYQLSSCLVLFIVFFFFSSRRRHTRSTRDWSSDVCSSDLGGRCCRAPHIATSAADAAFRCTLERGRLMYTKRTLPGSMRSEERRVGKECGGRGVRCHWKTRPTRQEVDKR